MVWLVVHLAGSIVSRASPVFAPADLRVAIGPCLLDAKCHGDDGIVVW